MKKNNFEYVQITQAIPRSWETSTNDLAEIIHRSNLLRCFIQKGFLKISQYLQENT